MLARLHARGSGHDARAQSGASLLVDLLLELVGEGFVMQLAQLVYVVPVWKVVVRLLLLPRLWPCVSLSVCLSVCVEDSPPMLGQRSARTATSRLGQRQRMPGAAPKDGQPRPASAS